MQQTQHAQMSWQMQEFIRSQQEQLQDVDHRLSTAELRLTEFSQEMEGSHEKAIGELVERLTSAERLLAISDSEANEGHHHIFERLQASQKEQMLH